MTRRILLLLLSSISEAEAVEAPFSKSQALLTDYAAHKRGEDWAPALARAFQDSAVVMVPAGRYFSTQVKLPGGATLKGAGEATVFVPLGTRLFDISGEEGEEIPAAADIADFSDTLLLTRSDSLQAGDDIMIRGQRNSMLREGKAGLNYSVDWVLGRTRKSSCFFGEMDVVATSESGRITTRSKRQFPDYFMNDSREPEPPTKGFVQRKSTTISKLEMAKNVVLKDLAIEGTTKCSMPIRLSHCKDCLVESILFTTAVESYERDGDPELSLVYAIYVWNTTIRRVKARLAPALLSVLEAKEKSYVNFSNYNLFKIISSTSSGFDTCEANGGTHAFNITRSASVASGGGIPSVDCFVRDCLASNCIWAGVKVQQGCYNTQVTGNTVTNSGQGIIAGGRKTLISENKLSTQIPHSSDYYYTHLERGGTFGIGLIEGYSCGSTVRNNRVQGFHSGVAVADGYEDKNCFEEGDIVIQQNVVSDCLRGFSLYKSPYCVSLGAKNLRLQILNNQFTCAEGGRSQRQSAMGAHLPPMTSGVELSGNLFRDFYAGVRMTGPVDFITIRGNQFEDCDVAADLEVVGEEATSRQEMRINEDNNQLIRTSTSRRGFVDGKVRSF